MFGGMKITGGSFGTDGYAYVKGDAFDIRSSRKQLYPLTSIARVDARTESQKNFGCFSFVLGAVIFGFILNAVIPGIGFIIGIVVAAALSFYTTKKQIVEVSFSDGMRVVVQCSNGQVRKLVSLPMTQSISR